MALVLIRSTGKIPYDESCIARHLGCGKKVPSDGKLLPCPCLAWPFLLGRGKLRKGRERQVMKSSGRLALHHLHRIATDTCAVGACLGLYCGIARQYIVDFLHLSSRVLGISILFLTLQDVFQICLYASSARSFGCSCTSTTSSWLHGCHQHHCQQRGFRPDPRHQVWSRLPDLRHHTNTWPTAAESEQ